MAFIALLAILSPMIAFTLWAARSAFGRNNR